MQEDDLVCVVDTDKVCLHWVHHWVLRVFCCALFCLQVAQDIMSPVQGEITNFHVEEGATVEVRNIGDAILMWV